MHVSKLALALGSLVALVRAGVDFDWDDVPRECRAVCQATHDLTERCDVRVDDLDGDGDDDDDDDREDYLEWQCVCTNTSFDVAGQTGQCADCLEQWFAGRRSVRRAAGLKSKRQDDDEFSDDPSDDADDDWDDGGDDNADFDDGRDDRTDDPSDDFDDRFDDDRDDRDDDDDRDDRDDDDDRDDRDDDDALEDIRRIMNRCSFPSATFTSLPASASPTTTISVSAVAPTAISQLTTTIARPSSTETPSTGAGNSSNDNTDDGTTDPDSAGGQIDIPAGIGAAGAFIAAWAVMMG